MIVNGNWMPYADGGNYFDAVYHVFRDKATQFTSLSIDKNNVVLNVPTTIINNVTGTPNLTLKRKAGQTADILATMNESGVAMPLAITAESRLKLGLISLGDYGMNGVIFRGLQDGGKNVLQFTDYTANGGYTLAVDNAAGWLTLHAAGDLYLDGGSINFRTAAYASMARFAPTLATFSTPVTMSSTLAVTGNATFSGSVTVPGPLSVVTTSYQNGTNNQPANRLATAQMFPWHDLLAFGAYNPVAERYNGTAWVPELKADTVNLFDSNAGTGRILCDATYSAWRCVWSGLLVTYVSQIIMSFAYTAANPVRNIVIETSPDGSVWTVRNNIVGVNWNTFPYTIEFGNSGFSNGTDNYMRITVTRTAASGDVILSELKGLTPRHGNQGLGPEVERPYTVDKYRKVQFMPTDPTSIVLAIRGATSQSGKLTQWINGAGAEVANVDAAGNFTVPALLLSGSSTNAAAAQSKSYIDAHDMPIGGTSGQVLVKTSATDYATSWQTLSPGGITPTSDVRLGRIGILDTNQSHHMMLKLNSDLTAERELIFVTGDAGRTITLGANVALNQDVQTVDAVTFARVRVTTNPGIVMNSKSIYLKTEGDSVHQIYASDLSSATPFADGPMLIGYSGWAHYNSFNGWAMGWRGAYVRPYMWMNGGLMVGTAPNDSINSLPGKIYAANNVSATQCEGRATVTEMYDSGAILANAGGFTAGPVGITLHPGGFATQIRQAYNDGSPYFRNLNNTGYPQVFMDVTDMSSLRYKESVRSLVDDRVRGTAQSSLNIVRQLRPIRYRVRKEQRLIKTDLTIHECSEDCIGPDAPNYTPENTCPQYRSWERGTAGFVAEELDALLPEASMRNAQDQPEGVKTLAIVAVLTDALQELIQRVEQLEGAA